MTKDNLTYLTLIPGTFTRKLRSRGKVGTYASYECKCGVLVERLVTKVNSGHIKSCGCYRTEVIIKAAKSCITHGESYSRLYRIWKGIKARCLRVTDKYYPRYGGRGIRLHFEWALDYVPFRDWALANGYQDHLTIDRIDNDGNYEPSNCQWITKAENTAKANRERGKNG